LRAARRAGTRKRALVEGAMGTNKCPKYGLDRPAARLHCLTVSQ